MRRKRSWSWGTPIVPREPSISPACAHPVVPSSMVCSWWSGAGSNRRPSAFQVKHAKRYADCKKKWTSPTSETALGGKCKIHASKGRYVLSTNQDSVPAPEGAQHTVPGGSPEESPFDCRAVRSHRTSSACLWVKRLATTGSSTALGRTRFPTALGQWASGRGAHA
jgi:hypothetical protein